MNTAIAGNIIAIQGRFQNRKRYQDKSKRRAVA